MKIELRNFKHYPKLSEETNAFTADIYIDGKHAGFVKNEGRGGDSFPQVPDKALREQMNAWICSQPAVKSDFGDIAMTLDFYFDRLAEEHLLTQEAKRLFANHLCFKDKTGNLLRTGRVAKATLDEIHSGKQEFKVEDGETLLKSVDEVMAVLKNAA